MPHCVVRRVLALGWAALLGGGIASGARGDDIPPPIDTEKDKTPVLAAAESLRTIRGVDGFRVSIFAAEPDVRNPIGMAWDPRGRLWVAENYTYAEPSVRFDTRHRDRVVIFDDADRDGTPEKRTVFTDDAGPLTSVEVGLGGAWLMCPPRLLFVPDRNGDDRPDGPAEVVLDGFTVPQNNYHNFANGLRWGPDGWLYGRCGGSSPGRVGTPGTADAQRIPLTGGIWRFDPAAKRFEVLAHGTTNPWGHDWDALGELFFINTVTGHLWHMIPGAHYGRMSGVDPNPRVASVIDQHADHYHWDAAKNWTDSRVTTPEHDRRGGGHAHSGLLIDNGGQWPTSDAGKMFTLNYHGRRINADRLVRQGSGFVGVHDGDRFFVGDVRFRGIDLSTGPDGSVFVLDWNDTGECHDHTGVHRNSGRVYQVRAEVPATSVPAPDLATSEGRIAAHFHPNNWQARMARRALADRRARGEPVETEANALRSLLAQADRSPRVRLEALWTLQTLGQTTPDLLRPLLNDPHEAVRTWAIRLLTDRLPIDTVEGQRPEADGPVSSELLADLARLASDDPSGLVRLALASTIQRLPHSERPRLAALLLRHAEDANDHNLPILVWTGLTPVDPGQLAVLTRGPVWPSVRRWIVRRLAEDIAANAAILDGSVLRLAARSDDPVVIAATVAGLADGLRGVRKAPAPAAWAGLGEVGLAERANRLGDPKVAAQVRELGVVFGDGRALDEIRRIALDGQADSGSRLTALQSLIAENPADLRALCEKVLKVPALTGAAADGLARFDDPGVARLLIASFPSFRAAERPRVVDALVTRPSFARALLDAVAAGKIPRGEIAAGQARSIRTLPDPSLREQLDRVWGQLADPSADKQQAIERIRWTIDAMGKPSYVGPGGNPSRGRATFNRLCASCHQLYGEGGVIGPNLTGSNRDNLDYLLGNIVTPSAVVDADFRLSVVALKDGRVRTGLVRSPTEASFLLVNQNETVTIPRVEVEQITLAPQSLMPEGLLDPLSQPDLIDLFAYLRSRSQVPLPPAGP